MPELPNPHDALFRATFEDPRLAAAFLRDHLPNGIAAHLADTIPEKIDGSFVDEALTSSQSDALFKVQTKSGKPAYLYFLLEHKSIPETALPLQLASYMIRVWRRHAKEHGDASLRALPPIVPLVLYAGSRRWTVPEGLGQMIAGDPELSFLPGASYILRNIGEIPTDRLSRDAALKAVLITMKREALECLTEVVTGLPEGSALRRQVIEYILRVYDDVDIEGISEALRRENATDLEAYVGTIADTLLAEGKARGLAEGLAVGEEKGLAEGKAETLTRQLERRFGPLPRQERARIAAAELGQIEAWLDAVLDAPDLKSVFAAGNQR